MDFSVIPLAIAKTCETGGHPLTEEQFQLIAGALGAAQMQIEAFGLEGTIEVLAPMATTEAKKCER